MSSKILLLFIITTLEKCYLNLINRAPKKIKDILNKKIPMPLATASTPTHLLPAPATSIPPIKTTVKEKYNKPTPITMPKPPIIFKIIFLALICNYYIRSILFPQL